MIVVDTSALMAVLLEEPEGSECAAILNAEPQLLMSAATLAEALIVAHRNGLRAAMDVLLATLEPEFVPVAAENARRAAEAYALWGKGISPARLNLGDSFAYALAKERGLPLLYIGNDFAMTDLVAARA